MSRLTQAVQRAGRLTGVELTRWRDPRRRLARFVNDADVTVALDVGANRGQFGSELRAAGFAGQIVSFEPLAEPFGRLEAAARRDERWDVHRLALGRENGTVRMNVAGNSSSSSILAIGETHLRALPESATVGTETVMLRRLDDILPELGLGDGRAFLKLDVQGFQLQVLEGAEGVLGEISAVQCELSVRPLYEGEPPLVDVVRLLEECGFRLVELEPGFRDPALGTVLQYDGRFIRPGRSHP